MDDSDGNLYCGDCWDRYSAKLMEERRDQGAQDRLTQRFQTSKPALRSKIKPALRSPPPLHSPTPDPTAAVISFATPETIGDCLQYKLAGWRNLMLVVEVGQPLFILEVGQVSIPGQADSDEWLSLSEAT